MDENLDYKNLIDRAQWSNLYGAFNKHSGHSLRVLPIFVFSVINLHMCVLFLYCYMCYFLLRDEHMCIFSILLYMLLVIEGC